MTRQGRESPHALTDGAWEPRGAVLVWRPDDLAAFHRWRTGERCGSDAGYQQHRADREDVCPPCRSAHNAAAKVHRVRRGAR